MRNRKVGNTAREPQDELIIVQGRRQEPDAVKSLAFVFHYKSKDGGLLKIGWLWLYSYQQKPKGSVSETEPNSNNHKRLEIDPIQSLHISYF